VKALTLPSGVTTTITLRVKDAVGCSVKEPRSVVFGSSGGSSTGVFGPLVSLGDGRHTATFTGHSAGSATQIDVTVDGKPVTSKPVTVSVVPGDISTRTSQITASQTTAAVGATVLLTLVSHDAAGNRVLVGGRAVTFIVAGNQTHGVTGATKDGRDGTYTASYTSSSAGSDTIVVLIDGTRVAQSLVITGQN
jgi:adhesin/invasin